MIVHYDIINYGLKKYKPEQINLQINHFQKMIIYK